MTTLDTLNTRPHREVSNARLADRGDLQPASLMVALECHRPMSLGRRVVLDHLDEVIVARGTVGGIERSSRAATIAVGDFQISRHHLAIRRTSSGWRLDDLGSKNGTVVNGSQVASAMLADGDVIEAGGTMLVFRQDDGPTYDATDRDLTTASALAGTFQTLSIELERRIHQIVKIAPSVVPVLVRGDTGTGKELMARAIHDASGRTGPFVPVNCGALPRDLIESELFGHRRGAFSGATMDREGLVRRAHGGTLFLDEIAELPPDSQAALLRVLQEGEVRPVGASDPVNVDVRVVAATHQDLHVRMADGRFRQDLYSRIAGFEIRMPALCDRREDLGMLIAAILPKTCPEPDQVTVSKAAARALFRYPWPLNIRELEQTLRAAVGLSDGREIRLEHLPEAIREHKRSDQPAWTHRDRVLRERLLELLRNAHGNVAAVGRAMDRAPIQIRRWCRRLQIDLETFRQ